MKRKASAVWQGDFKNGKGTISTETGALSGAPYSFTARFEGARGTNPEELIGAAHAGCFSMALAAQLGESGLTPERIETASTVTLEKTPDGFTITGVQLDVTARVPGASREAFDAAAKKAKEGCPVSKLLRAPIGFNATLEG